MSGLSLRVLSIASEFFPLIKTGGLADIAGALPAAMAREDVHILTLLPAYPAVLAAVSSEPAVDLWDLPGGPANILRARSPSGADLLLLDAPHLYARPGGPYHMPDGREWPDNALRFAALARAAEHLGRGALPGYLPDIVHAHDWQTALAPAYLALGAGPRPKTVVTIHNIAFQGLFPPDLLPSLHLPTSAFAAEGVEFYGQIGFLKAGLFYADKITTVSPSYAREIQSAPEGYGLEGLLRKRAVDLSGILNGLDVDIWNPASDPSLPQGYDANDLAGKAAAKLALQQTMGLAPDPEALLFAVISRLTGQKGLDLVLQALPLIRARGGQLALLGTGEPALERGFRAAALADPKSIACRIGYDEGLAHLIQAGSDAILIPSRFEPCGLTQLAGLCYGTLPIVTRVGGLGDTVIDANEAALADGVATGIIVPVASQPSLELALERGFDLWQQQTVWQTVRRRAMTRSVGWDVSARHYRALYDDLLRIA
ncbi:starch synthase [Arboricoccus pini]|uniref:Glycogen synthase n=1 Tax=Arboricoccus pini TaxID=1963835 RepID=A0A212R4A1_9PROT|nr:glycogen synthase GlgA [Arboricoccus pini]SNB66840.1 starch synthase [Arboricoccus pini]